MASSTRLDNYALVEIYGSVDAGMSQEVTNRLRPTLTALLQ